MESLRSTRLNGPAGFWIRAGAFAVDQVITQTVTGIAISYLVVGTGQSENLLGLFLQSALAILLTAGGWTAYNVGFIAIRGQTLGKMAFGIKVVDEHGARPGLWRTLLRETFGKFISSLFFGIGFVIIGLNDDKRGWHDDFADTYVVRVPQMEPADR